MHPIAPNKAYDSFNYFEIHRLVAAFLSIGIGLFILVTVRRRDITKFIYFISTFLLFYYAINQLYSMIVYLADFEVSSSIGNYLLIPFSIIPLLFGSLTLHNQSFGCYSTAGLAGFLIWSLFSVFLTANVRYFNFTISLTFVIIGFIYFTYHNSKSVFNILSYWIGTCLLIQGIQNVLLVSILLADKLDILDIATLVCHISTIFIKIGLIAYLDIKVKLMELISKNNQSIT
ncbi:hypothetical protein K502DRAFT_349426 [Neoconidiobolus thromboides FSU 785]|nr:hypothetical protein K502DRAFT_349426 [Neoconidiobolus thromboides FSU 785]